MSDEKPATKRHRNYIDAMLEHTVKHLAPAYECAVVEHDVKTARYGSARLVDMLVRHFAGSRYAIHHTVRVRDLRPITNDTARRRFNAASLVALQELTTDVTDTRSSDAMYACRLSEGTRTQHGTDASALSHDFLVRVRASDSTWTIAQLHYGARGGAPHCVMLSRERALVALQYVLSADRWSAHVDDAYRTLFGASAPRMHRRKRVHPLLLVTPVRVRSVGYVRDNMPEMWLEALLCD